MSSITPSNAMNRIHYSYEDGQNIEEAFTAQEGANIAQHLADERNASAHKRKRQEDDAVNSTSEEESDESSIRSVKKTRTEKPVERFYDEKLPLDLNRQNIEEAFTAQEGANIAQHLADERNASTHKRKRQEDDAVNSTSEEESNESSIRSVKKTRTEKPVERFYDEKLPLDLNRQNIEEAFTAQEGANIAQHLADERNASTHKRKRQEDDAVNSTSEEESNESSIRSVKKTRTEKPVERFYDEKLPLDLKGEIYSYLPEKATVGIKGTSKAIYEETLDNVKWVLINKKDLKFNDLLLYSFHFLKKSDRLIIGEKFKDNSYTLSAEDGEKIYPAIEEAASLCTNLNSLSLSGFRCITNFSFLEKIPNLKELDLSGCNIADITLIPTSIETLDLQGGCEHIPEENFSNLSRFNNLKKIYLFGDCKISDLKLLPSSIELLHLNCCHLIPEENFIHLNRFNNLKDILLWHCEISDLEFIPTSIETLNIRDCHIPEENFIHLNRFNNLKEISLICCEISDLNLIPTSIETLDIRDCPNIPEENFIHLNRFNNLKTIRLHKCKISDLKLIPTSIETLDISDCPYIPEENFIHLNRFNNLKEISLSGCNIADITFIKTSINRLRIIRCQNIPEENFIHLNRFNDLKILLLNDCKIIDISSIPTTIESLRFVNLTIHDISHLLGFPKLRNLALPILDNPLIQAHIENLRSKGVSVSEVKNITFSPDESL